MGQQVGAGYSYQPCPHDGSIGFDEFFSVTLPDGREVTFLGAKEYTALDNVDDKSTLIVGMTNKVFETKASRIVTHSDFEDVLDKYESRKNFKQITIDCKDGYPPKLKYEFWLKLREIIENSDVEKVIFYCFGGHGRTGTGLACMYLAFFEDNYVHTINALRAFYCLKAVETKEQIRYIENFAKFVDVYFKRNEDVERAKAVKIPKDLQRKLDKEYGTGKKKDVVGSKQTIVTSTTKPVSPPSSSYSGTGATYVDGYDDQGEINWGLQDDTLICACGKHDNSVTESVIDGKVILECETCFMSRIKNTALDGKTDLAVVEDKRREDAAVGRTMVKCLVCNSLFDKEFIECPKCKGEKQRSLKDVIVTLDADKVTEIKPITSSKGVCKHCNNSFDVRLLNVVGSGGLCCFDCRKEEDAILAGAL